MVWCSSPVAVTYTSDMGIVLSKESLNIQANIEGAFTMKRVHDMTRTYSEMHRADKYSQFTYIIGSDWVNG